MLVLFGNPSPSPAHVVCENNATVVHVVSGAKHLALLITPSTIAHTTLNVNPTGERRR